MSAVTPEEVVAREASGRTKAGIAAIAAGVLTLAGGLLASSIYADFPRVFLVEALRDAGGLEIGRPGLRTEQILFYDEKAASLLSSSALLALAAMATGIALVFLADATRVRRPEAPRLMRGVILFGAVALAVSEIALQGTAAKLATDFASSSDQGTQAAHDALRSDVLIAAQFVRFAGQFALALGFILAGLNGMRAGLLTRFMGVLCIIVGALIVFPVGSQLPIVQAFWLVALGVLYLGRWPNGSPPALEQGVAVPWPSQQRLREERDAATGGAPARPTRVEPTTEAPSPATSAKKKRKRRG